MVIYIMFFYGWKCCGYDICYIFDLFCFYGKFKILIVIIIRGGLIELMFVFSFYWLNNNNWRVWWNIIEVKWILID